MFKRTVSVMMLTLILTMLLIPVVLEIRPVNAYKSGPDGTHDFIFDQAATILYNDGFVPIADFLNSRDPNDPSGRTYLGVMKAGSTDHDGLISAREHYMDPMDHTGLYFGGYQKSAGTLCQEVFDSAVNKWVVSGDFHNAIYYLGWATHLVQDVCVPHHAQPTSGNWHSEYEDWVNSYKYAFAISSGGIYSFSSFPDRQYYLTSNSGSPVQANWHYDGVYPTAYDWVDYNAHESTKYFLYVDGNANSDPTDANIVQAETIHPLPNNLDTNFTFVEYGASAMQLYFDKINMTSDVDYVRIYDAFDNLLASYTGVQNGLWTQHFYNTGGVLKVRATTNSSAQSWGYKISQVHYHDRIEDPSYATYMLLPQAQRTTAGFIKRFFDWVDACVVKFDATGLDSSATGTVLAVGGVPVTTGQIPYYRLVAYGSFIDYSYRNVPSLTPGKVFILSNITGPASQTAVTHSVNVIGNYIPRTIPTVSITPSSAAMYKGQSQLFTSTVSSGTSPYSYQWYLFDSSIGGNNLVVNPGFETGSFTGWNQEGPNNAEIRDDEKHTGSYCSASYYVWPNTSQYLPFKITEKLPTVPSNLVSKVSCWCRYGVAGLDWLRVNYTDGSVSSIGLGSPSVWTYVTLNLAANKTLDSLILERISTGGSVICVDDVELNVNGTPVSGATGSTWTFTPSSTGTYNVCVHVTDNTGLSTYSNIATVTVNPVAFKLTVFSAHDSPSPPNGVNLYSDGQSVTCNVSTPVTEGGVAYACTGWSGTGSVPSNGNGTSLAFTVIQNSTITWNWQVSPPKYALTIAANVGGTTDPSPGTYLQTYGSAVPITAIASLGYDFDYWGTIGSVIVANQSNPSTSVTVNGNGTVTAFFRQLTVPYTLSLNSRQDNYGTANFGTIIVEVVSYSLPRDISKEARNYSIQYSPTSGYEFSRWETSDGASIANQYIPSTTVTVNGNGTVTAIYTATIVTYTVNLDSRQDTLITSHLGNITLDGITYSLPNRLSNQTAGTYSIRYNIASGYEFDHWETTGGVNVTNTNMQFTSVTVSDNGNITAIYKKSIISYTIYLASQEYNGTTSNLGIIQLDNQYFQLPKDSTRPSGVYLIDYFPASGNIFLQWETTSNITITNTTSQQTSVIINGTGTITAVFIRSTPVTPAISEVKAFYTLDSFFLGDMPGLVPPNQYFVRGNNISAAEFTIYINSTKQTYLDLTPDQDGWFSSDPIDMAEVTSNLTITTYSMTGDSASQIVFTNVYQTPTWLRSSINVAEETGYLTVKIDPAQPLTGFDKVWNMSLDYHWPETPMDALYDIPVPIIGGKYGITCGFGFTLSIQSNAKAVIGGGGGLQFYIADAEAKVGIYVTGVIEIQNGTIRLQNLAITINGAIQVPFQHKYSWNGIGLEVGVYVGGSVSCTLYLQETPSGDGTFGYGLDWVATKADIALWMGAYAQVGLWVGEVRIEGKGKVTFTFHMPPPYFTYPDDMKLEASITLTVRCWWFCWQKDIFTYSSHSPVQWTLNSSQTGWIPREWANSNYSLYEWPANAKEGTFLGNVYPYANPSVETSSNSTIMVWTQDDLSKPYIQGYEIYYATLDPKTGNWSLPAPVTNDTIPEGDAVVKFDSKGNAVAVWTQLNESSLNETMDPFSLLKKVQLVYAVWNSATKTWSQPRQITTDEIFHYSPTLISDNETGNLMLIWMADNDGNLTTYNDESICSSIWNGTAWSAPTLVATPGLLASSVSGAYDQGKAALVWSQNMGGNATNLSDIEIFSIEFNGTSWTPPARLTNNNLADISPSVTYWNNYPVYAWVQRVQNQSDVMMVLEPHGDSIIRQVLERPTVSSPILKVDSYNKLLLFWTNSDLPYSSTINSDGTITIAEMANGDNSSKNIYCGVYKYAAGMADLNYDGIVDIYDAIGLAGAFNSVPGSHNWNTNADIDGNGIVDLFDAIALANNYEKTFSNRIGCRQIAIPR